MDETKSVAAFRDGIACGMTTFQDRFGPNWRAHLQQIADEQAEARRLGISLATSANPASPAAPDDGDGGPKKGED